MRRWNYRLYGLPIRSTLALPGVRTVPANGEPALLLTRAGEGEVLDGWDPTKAQPISSARLSDGERFSIERGSGGTYLFRYGRAAMYRWKDRRLVCAPAEGRSAAHASSPTWLHVLLDSVLCSVSLLHGFEALRATAVELRGGVVAFIAPPGGGRSALAAEFLQRGDALVCDEVLALHRDDGTVRAHPGPPHLTLALPADSRVAPTSIGVTIATFGSEAWVAARRGAGTSAPLRAVCLLERGVGRRIELLKAPANPLMLLPHALVIDDRLGRPGERFALYSELARCVPIYRLRAPVDASTSELADAVEARFPQPLASSTRRKRFDSRPVDGRDGRASGQPA